MLRLLLSVIFAAALTGCVLSDTFCEGPSKGWHKFGDYCYLFKVGTDKRVSYYDAEDFCRTQGAHLVSILSEKENKFLAETVASHTYYYGRMWIGLNTLQGPKKYQWSDGQPFNYQNFLFKQQYKKESCFIFYGNAGGWRPEHCGLHYTPLCKRPATDVEPSPLPPLTPDIPEGNCPSGWIQFGHRCYKYFGAKEADRLKFKQAKKACMDLGENHDLVSIHSMEEQAFLTQRLDEFGTSAWIGFNYIESDEIGHDIVFGWTDNSRENFTYWAAGNPPRGTWKYCAYLNTEGFGKGEWVADYCDIKQRGYICQRLPDASVPKPPEQTSKCDENSVGFRDSCYRYFSDAQSWYQAEATCQKNGGHLVSINDGYEQNFLYCLTGAKSESLWTGLKNVKDTRIFKWSNGSPLYFSNWGKSQPDLSDLQSSCVSTSAADILLWNVTKCESQMPFICEVTEATLPPLPADVIGVCPSSVSPWIDIGDNYCYEEGSQVSSKTMQWGDNSRYCMSKGMEMISLSSEHQMKVLFSYLWKRNYNYWLGLIRSFDKESFIWTDGSSLSYTSWAENEPSAWSRNYKKDCVAVSMNDLKWYPSVCSDWSGYICRVKKTLPGQSVRVARSEHSFPKTNECRSYNSLDLGSASYLLDVLSHNSRCNPRNSQTLGTLRNSNLIVAAPSRKDNSQVQESSVAAPSHKEDNQVQESSGLVPLLVATIVCMGLSVFVAAMVFAWKRRNEFELPTTVVPVGDSEESSNENVNTQPKY